MVPICIALEKNSIEMGKLLLSKGADVNVRDVIYQTIELFFAFSIILNR